MDAGAGFNALAAAGVQAGQDKIQRKRDTADEERRLKATDLINTRNNILSKMPTLLGPNGEKTPEYDQAFSSLTQTQQDLGQLYHPDKAPGKLQQDWAYLLEKMHGITAPKDKTPSSVATQQPAVTLNPPVAPLVTPELPAYDQTTPSLPTQGGSITEHVPGVAAATGPGMGSTPITLPAGPQTTVTKAPPVPWGQAQVLKQKAVAMQKAQHEAGVLADGVGPSPQQQAMRDLDIQSAVSDAKIAHTMKLAKDLGLDETQMNELKQQMVGLKNVVPKPLTGAAGQPYKAEDGLYYQNVSNSDGTVGRRLMPPEWKPNTKSIAGTIINTKEHGWIKTWVDPYTQKVTGWQPFTPGRQYLGSDSSSESVDSMGVKTSSARSTKPVGTAPVSFDFSGKQELPSSYTGDDSAPSSVGAPVASAPSGSPNKTPTPAATPPKSVATPAIAPPVTAKVTPAQVKSQVPYPPQAPTAGQYHLDEQGHIPDGDIQKYGLNPNLVQVTNNILDGADATKIPIKDRGAAEDLAKKYGWGGQGMFSPQQKLQIRESSTFLNDALKNDSLSVLNSWTSRQKLIAFINNAEGHAGWSDAAIARNTDLNDKEAEFLRMFRQLTGTISGLASLTRPGRPTEAGIKRLMAELPNPNESHSSKDGKERIKRLIKEIEIATQKGNADDLLGSGSKPSTNGNSGQITSDQLMDMYMQHKQAPKK